jgi:hypothetical protein
MKSVLRYTAAGLAVASLGFASNASAATANAQVAAEVLSTLQLRVSTTDNVLNFGTVTDAGLIADSTVVVSPAAGVTCGANLTCGGTANAPTFEIQGFTGSTVVVSFPSATITLDRAGTDLAGLDNDMAVGAFTTSLAGNSTQLVAGGFTANPFTIGGTLTVSPLQAPGVYTGAVTVEVQYN